MNAGEKFNIVRSVHGKYRHIDGATWGHRLT